MEELLVGIGSLVVGAALGVVASGWRLRRPRKVVSEDRNAGLSRYQDHKAGR